MNAFNAESKASAETIKTLQQAVKDKTDAGVAESFEDRYQARRMVSQLQGRRLCFVETRRLWQTDGEEGVLRITLSYH